MCARQARSGGETRVSAIEPIIAHLKSKTSRRSELGSPMPTTAPPPDNFCRLIPCLSFCQIDVQLVLPTLACPELKSGFSKINDSDRYREQDC